jgi:ribose transport system ATP-binding protein
LGGCLSDDGLNRSTPLVLEILDVSKTFGGVRALEGVSFRVAAGEIHGLLGQNGSGKSTLVKILAGYHAPDPGTGRLKLGGEDVDLPLSPSVVRGGVGFVHQDLGLVDSLTVWENIFVAEYETGIAGTIDIGALRIKARTLLETFDLDIDPDTGVADLSEVQKAEIAILRAIGDSSTSGQRQLLVLDEPTAYLPKTATDQLFRLIRRAALAGTAVIFVSHKLGEVLDLCDMVTVLRDGRDVGTESAADLTEEGLIELILGRSLSAPVPRPVPAHTEAAPIVSASSLRSRRLDDVSIEFREGEIVGATGLIGAGHEELPYVLFGGVPGRGHLTVAGISVNLNSWSPERAIRAGMALVPANRSRDGLVPTETVSSNIAILHLGRHTGRAFMLKLGALARWIGEILGRYQVTPQLPDQPISALSGGNQQKVVLAKWLELSPTVLLLHEPTQGIDVGTKREVHRLLRSAASRGAAILVASVEYDELAELCGRVEIMASGRISQTLEGTAITGEAVEEAVLRAAASERNGVS